MRARRFRGGQTTQSSISYVWVQKIKTKDTHLVELIAEVYRVDVVAFEVGEHDDLRAEWDKIGVREGLEGGG